MIRLVILRILESYFRHRWLYLVPLVLMTAVAGAYIFTSERDYLSSGTMYVQTRTLLSTLSGDKASYSYRTPAQITSNEIRELLQTEAFVRSAIQQTSLESRMSSGPDTVEETLKHFTDAVWATPAGDNLIVFGATDKDPTLAQQMANALVNTYIQWNKNSGRQESVVAQTFFADLITPYQRELDSARQELRDYLRKHPLPVRGERPAEEQLEIDRMQSAVNEASDRLSSALEKEEAARLSMKKSDSITDQAYTVVDAPQVPLKPNTSLRSLAIEGAIFATIGAVLSLAAVLGGALMDRSFRFPLDVHHGLNLPVLAMVPQVKTPRRKRTPAPEKQRKGTTENPDSEVVGQPAMAASSDTPLA
ncbi:lipopolysaccharide biosynthesis protein [Candidatus Gracilibacteria bacterium]|nr:lipopolysaccharide biosynthesis protein [Candidatus Gracilibacteria bacterium]